MRAHLDFLRYCLKPELPLPSNANRIDWKEMLAWAESQAIVGIVFGGLEKLNDTERIVPSPLLLEWIAYANRIEQQNKLLNKKCLEVVKEYRDAGYDCVVLKGQGNAVLYPNPLLRTSGDIDLLIKDANRKRIIECIKSKHTVQDIRHHHAEYIDDHVPVEIHFIPCQMNNPFYHKRLMVWLKEHEEWRYEKGLPNGIGSIPVPTFEFNIVFQLAHMMHHFFDEGIGLRQMIDYYYLLMSDGRGQMEDVKETLKYLNLYKFAGAVMYIMKEVLGLEEKYLIVPVDERRGKTLLREILKGGNFGHSSNLAQNNAAKKYFQKTWRNMHFVREYPAEALCEPIFRTWHFFWRMAHR